MTILSGVLSKVTETQKNEWTEPATFPFSLHRAERSRTIDKTPPPSGDWAPRDDNIPLSNSHYSVMLWRFSRLDCNGEHRCFARCILVVATGQRQCRVEKIYNKFTCARAHKCALHAFSLDLLPWVGISFRSIREHDLNIFSRILLCAHV